MKACIGITSYLPDEETVRTIRTERLTQLLKQCQEYFDLDILIIAQNWGELKFDYPRLNVDYYPGPLGITPARIKLREKFLASDYDYIIMMDDDTDLCGTAEDYQTYLDIVDREKKGFYWVNNYYIRLCCISREGFRRIGFDGSIIPERGLGWEDVIFNKKCRKYLTSLVMPNSDRLLAADRTAAYCIDPHSTWDNLNRQLQYQNGAKTRAIRSTFEQV